MKKHIKKIITAIIIIAILTFAYWWGGDSPGLRGWDPSPETENNVSQVASQVLPENEEPSAEPSAEVPSEKKEELKDEKTQKPEKENKEALQADTSSETSEELTEEKTVTTKEEVAEEVTEEVDVPEESPETEEKQDPEEPQEPVQHPAPITPENEEITDKELNCTLSVKCDTILSNMSWLDSSKTAIIPQDGVVFPEKTVVFYEGETVFNVLLREMKRNRIHMEYVSMPVYNSVYIEGIGNIYEFDCGELSGWMYKVNGWFPNYGSSRYKLKDGDKIEWVYTCSLGEDVGGGYASRNGR